MMLGRSVSSAKFSGEALNERHTGAGSSGVTANIFPPTLKSRSYPHWICSVTPGNDKQTSHSQSTFMSTILGRRGRRHQRVGRDSSSASACRFPSPRDFLYRADHKKIRKRGEHRDGRHNCKSHEETPREIDDESGYGRRNDARKIP